MRSLAPLTLEALAGAARWTKAHPSAPLWAWWFLVDVNEVNPLHYPYCAEYSTRPRLCAQQCDTPFRYSKRTEIRKAYFERISTQPNEGGRVRPGARTLR